MGSFKYTQCARGYWSAPTKHYLTLGFRTFALCHKNILIHTDGTGANISDSRQLWLRVDINLIWNGRRRESSRVCVLMIARSLASAVWVVWTKRHRRTYAVILTTLMAAYISTLERPRSGKAGEFMLLYDSTTTRVGVLCGIIRLFGARPLVWRSRCSLLGGGDYFQKLPLRTLAGWNRGRYISIYHVLWVPLRPNDPPSNNTTFTSSRNDSHSPHRARYGVPVHNHLI